MMFDNSSDPAASTERQVTETGALGMVIGGAVLSAASMHLGSTLLLAGGLALVLLGGLGLVLRWRRQSGSSEVGA